ncbi:hypothetical protein NGF19_28185 [Streptomyces sp. RY43-2]|uniref:Uncharacterized protein n=1 Tax=Streptomyces macrolidinus TaxID=2952607 RepID=A0ABT0ZLZ7_9ACTN|nr:hypothetical protein [Streptomyces macrolidinus]MCN9244614.1 hypothetical protein [Streptomyces macrolidinus]
MAAAHEARECPVCREPWLVLADPAALPRRMGELAAAARRLDAVDAVLHPAGDPVIPQPGAEEYDEHDEHDVYFGVARAREHSTDAFLLGGLHTHHVVAVHQERCGCGDPRDLDVLSSGWRCLLEYPDGAVPPAACPAHTADDDAALTDCPRPHEHWRVGHQLFFVLIQAVVAGVQCFLGELRAGDARAATRALGLASEMCRHSALAMKFAGGLSPVDYEYEVRPSMLPPMVRRGFSGFQTRDHALLVKTLRAARPSLRSLGLHDPAVLELDAALQRVYAAHRLVCARFDGTKIPSLLMEASGPESAKRAGTDVVDELTARRLSLLREPPSRPEPRS